MQAVAAGKLQHPTEDVRPPRRLRHTRGVLAHDGRCVGGCHLERIAAYAEHELARGESLPAITRHMLGLLSHVPGAREYRRLLSEGARAPGAGPELLR